MGIYLIYVIGYINQWYDLEIVEDKLVEFESFLYSMLSNEYPQIIELLSCYDIVC